MLARAIGFLRAPFGFESGRSAYSRISRFDAGAINQTIADLSAEAISFVRSGSPEADPDLECTAYMRYVGQGWEVPVAIEVHNYTDADGELFRKLFDEQYDISSAALLKVSMSRSSVGRCAPPRKSRPQIGLARPRKRTKQKFAAAAKFSMFRKAVSRRPSIVARADMKPGDFVAGPAVITERETSTIITASREVIMQADGCLLIRVQAERLNGGFDMKTSALSDVHMQIMWNRLISVVEEQAVTLIRTAFSTSVRESGDLSAGVFNRGGKMIAQAVTGTPGHVNAMAEAVGHFIRDIGPENIFEGDVYITNDPWKGPGTCTTSPSSRPASEMARWLAISPARPMWWMSVAAVLARTRMRSTKRASSFRS